ncbi:hypothetical protein [Microbacterium sp. A84]|uniref:hypothetical protein n=1 Tax=Microbacterium sp. A84 TaxID=3450715 RepID=UPI003F4360A3
MGAGVQDDLLREACVAWQDGRDGGSSPLRAAARVLTGTPHYFEADFISHYERVAAADPLTMSRARFLLSALAAFPRMTAAGWSESTGFGSSWAGRGIKSGNQDGQISAALETGSLTMPLWGLSLDRDVALSFGRKFLFELIGPFPAFPAWIASGIKSEERELIAGGRYDVERIAEDPSGTTIVQLRFVETVTAN